MTRGSPALAPPHGDARHPPAGAAAGPPAGIRRWWPVVAVGTLALLLTAIQLARVPIYLTADAGHYLADADAVFGHGVRESRHLPAFPALIGVMRLFLGDLGAVAASMLAVIALLVFGFHEFVGRRLAAPGPEAVGALFFILSPVFAEGVGWYGASMLMGLGLALIAMRRIDDALVEPAAGRAVKAGVACGLVGLTHPLPFLVLAQVSAIAVTVLVVIEGRRQAASSGGHGVAVRPWLLRRAATMAAVAAIAGVMVLPWLHFYTSLESPVALSFNPARLAELGSWAFREDLPLWIGIVVVSGVILIGASRRLDSEPQFRMAVWTLVACAVPIVTVLLVSGNPSYTSRYLYLLPLTLGCTVAVGCVVVARKMSALGGRARTWAAGLMVLALIISAIRAGQAYTRRLEVALDYYSNVSSEELAAIRWVGGQPGTVVVSPKGGDKVAGTLYAWMLEGLAKKRAIGTDEAFIALLKSAHLDSIDVERLLAGSAGVDNGTLRIAGSEGDRTPVEVAGLVAGDWYPLFSVDIGPASDPGAPNQAAASGGPGPTGGDGSGTGDGGELVVDHHGITLRGALSAARPAEVELALRQSSASAPVAVDIRPSLAARNIQLRAAGDEATLNLDLPGGPVRIVLAVDGALPAHVERDARSGAGRIRIEADPGHQVTITARIAGLDETEVPALDTFSDIDLIRRHGVRTVFTWKQTALAPALSDRRCFRPVMENDEVVVLGVTPECTPAP